MQLGQEEYMCTSFFARLEALQFIKKWGRQQGMNSHWFSQWMCIAYYFRDVVTVGCRFVDAILISTSKLSLATCC